MSGGALKFYDRGHRRLVFIRRRADERYWDDHWEERDARAAMDSPGHARFFVDLTRRHLPEGGRILEGGCGPGEKLMALGRAGFQAHGVDTAAATLRRLREMAPDLSVAQCDVRGLCFVDGSFDGYWSIGVIEHFYDGFTPLAREMQRVVRPGGFLFLTFPAMTPLRRLKAALRMYPAWDEGAALAHKERFYQFALAEREVAALLEADHGFRVVARARRGGMRGLKEEARPLHALIKPLRRLLDPLIASLAGHSAVLVLRKV